ncbi:MAG: hypothetical protein ABEJ06_03815 [Haloarculaceae archaeon]
MGRRLSRRDALRAGLAAGTAALAGCTDGAFVDFEADFESPGRWETGAAIGPEVDLSAFDWRVERSQEQAYEGSWSLELFTGGDHDDGTAWAVWEIPVTDGLAYDVDFEVQAWSESESFNTLRHLVARVAPDPPATEADFPDPGRNSSNVADAPYGGLREPLHREAGWTEYGFDWRSPPLSADSLYLAVGVSVVWEADATHYVDEVELDLSPV